MGDTVKIESNKSSYKQGELITLTATIQPPRQDVTWEWKFVDTSQTPSVSAVQPEEGDVLKTLATGVGKGTFRATARHNDTDLASAEIEVTVTSAGTDPPANPDQPNQPANTEPLKFHWLFAVITGVLVLALLGLFVWQAAPFGLSVSLVKDAETADPRAVLAAKVMGPMLALGALVLLAGLWMVLVEWRGAFSTAKADGVSERSSIVEILKVVGDLKGAGQVFVGGLVIVLAVAWMVSSTAGAETDPAPTPSSSETGTAPATEPTAPATEPATPAPEPTSTP